MAPNGTEASPAKRWLADVAVPLPLPAPLTYELPTGAERLPLTGGRVRVQVGKRRLIGIVVKVHDQPPHGIALRPIDRILDRRPILPADLLDLARFTAEYYLAPLGEVLRCMFPADLPPWENPTVSLTTNYHKNIGKWVLLALVLLHIAAIVYYLRRKHNLVGAMLHGDKDLVVQAPSSRDDTVSRVAAVLILAICGGAAYWVSTLAAPAF